jgi:hypothetical protein
MYRAVEDERENAYKQIALKKVDLFASDSESDDEAER